MNYYLMKGKLLSQTFILISRLKIVDTKTANYTSSYQSLGEKNPEKENTVVGRIMTPSMMSWDSGAVGIKVPNQLSLKQMGQ